MFSMTKPKLLVQTKATPRILQIQQVPNETSVALDERTRPGTDGYEGDLSEKLLDSFQGVKGSVYLEWL